MINFRVVTTRSPRPQGYRPQGYRSRPWDDRLVCDSCEQEAQTMLELEATAIEKIGREDGTVWLCLPCVNKIILQLLPYANTAP